MAESSLHSIHNLAHEFEIAGADGEVQTGANGRVGVTVYPDGKSKMRKRNGIRWPGGRKVQWLYAELDGVRVYVKDDDEKVNIVLTKQDLYP